MPRTFAIGDIHGDLDHLRVMFGKLPLLKRSDTIVLMGDYIDRGPHSKEVVQVVRSLERDVACKVVCLRGNHEDAWLRVLERGWPDFVFPPDNGCLATMRSYLGGPTPVGDEIAGADEIEALFAGSFFPADVVAWMKTLPYWYEDEHAIYVHAGLVERDGVWPHPRDVVPPTGLMWTRTERFFRDYKGKRVVVGHTVTQLLPPELSSHTPEDPTDLWAGENVIAIDTGCGKGGFLTAVELPSLTIYETR